MTQEEQLTAWDALGLNYGDFISRRRLAPHALRLERPSRKNTPASPDTMLPATTC